MRAPYLLLISTLMIGPVLADTPPPAKWKRNLIPLVQHIVKDPYSIRDAQYSGPYEENGKWEVCIRFNAKNEMGGYTGLRDHEFIWEKPIWTVDRSDNDIDFCRGPMKPFPELNGKG